MTSKEIIAVVQAFERGETIEYRSLSRCSLDEKFYPCSDPSWDFYHDEYRVKSKPREFWVNVYPTFSATHDSAASAAKSLLDARGGKTIRVREILE